jgi:FG-GAP-like repeat
MTNPSPNPLSKVVVLALACVGTVLGCNQRSLIGQVDGGQDGTTGQPGSAGSSGGPPTNLAGVGGSGWAGGSMGPSGGAAGNVAGFTGSTAGCTGNLFVNLPGGNLEGTAGFMGLNIIADPTTSQPLAFAPPTDWPALEGATSMAIGDVNGDGMNDIVVAGPAGIRILVAGTGGKFAAGLTFPIPNASIVLGDVTGDGKVDIVAVTRQDVFVLAKNANGTFDVPVAPSNRQLGGAFEHPALADMNDDGKLDLVVVDNLALTNVGGKSHVAILTNEGNRIFGTTTTSVAAGNYLDALAVGRVNGDACPDVVVANFDDDSLSVFAHKCLGGAELDAPRTWRTGGHPSGVAIGRLDANSETADLVASIQSPADVNVLLGANSSADFGPVARFNAGAGAKAVALGDLNGDGQADAVVGLSGGVSVLLGRGDGTFDPPRTAKSPCGARKVVDQINIGLADLDGDGRLDIAATSSVRSVVTVFLNRM